MNKKLSIIICSSLGLIILLTGILLALFLNGNHPSLEQAYGDFSGDIVLSEDFNSVLESDFYKYTRDIIEEALTEYLSTIYPSGAGLEYTRYDVTKDNYSLRFVDSYGTFHSISIKEAEDSVTVKIDDIEKTYEIVIPDRGEEDED